MKGHSSEHAKTQNMSNLEHGPNQHYCLCLIVEANTGDKELQTCQVDGGCKLALPIKKGVNTNRCMVLIEPSQCSDGAHMFLQVKEDTYRQQIGPPAACMLARYTKQLKQVVCKNAGLVWSC